MSFRSLPGRRRRGPPGKGGRWCAGRGPSLALPLTALDPVGQRARTVSDACRPLAVGSVAEPKSHPLRRSGVGGYCWASVWLITLKGTHGDPPEPPLSVKAVVTSPSLSVTAAPRVHRCLQSSVKCPGGMGPPMQRRTLSPECKEVSPAATHVTPNTSPSDSGAA